MTPAETLLALRARTPLVHNITNLVVTNFTANALLALGASPAMVEGIDEVAAFAARADALVINLGTMTRARAAAMRAAAAAARRAGRPWVLDPVAVGVLDHRTRVALGLLEFRPAAIRGNASEIIALARLARAHDAGQDGPGSRGVDSGDTPEAALPAACALALHTGAVVTVSGAVDHVTDGTRLARIAHGHALMPRVTGLGCAATALIGACLAVAPPFEASVGGALFNALAGERAGAGAAGPGSLAAGFLDALYLLDADQLAAPRIIEERIATQAAPDRALSSRECA